MNSLSTFLYARPSFAEGIARLADFGGTLMEYNRSESDEMADYLALWADWRLIGMDLQRAMLRFNELAEKENHVVEREAQEATATR